MYGKVLRLKCSWHTRDSAYMIHKSIVIIDMYHIGRQGQGGQMRSDLRATEQYFKMRICS